MVKVREGDTLAALVHFEKALEAGGAPACLSYFAYCIARERGQVTKGLKLCCEALEKDPVDPVHYLNMARIHLLASQKTEALEVLRKAAALEANDEVSALLEEVGTRKPPPISFLHRDHPVNKYLGMLTSKLRQR